MRLHKENILECIFLLFFADIAMDWSDHAMWWPEKNMWLDKTRWTLDQYNITADAIVHFTPMHKMLRVQLPDLRYVDCNVDFSVKTFNAVINLCSELGKYHTRPFMIHIVLSRATFPRRWLSSIVTRSLNNLADLDSSRTTTNNTPLILICIIALCRNPTPGRNVSVQTRRGRTFKNQLRGSETSRRKKATRDFSRDASSK